MIITFTFSKKKRFLFVFNNKTKLILQEKENSNSSTVISTSSRFICVEFSPCRPRACCEYEITSGGIKGRT
jgi:hypothetical protein